MKSATFRLPSCKCPSCNGELSAATNAVTYDDSPSSTPTKGDITFCIYCAEVLVFNEDLTVREFRKEDLDKLSPDEILRIALMGNLAKKIVARRAERTEQAHLERTSTH